ncbi:hypothetical protein A3D77_07740 [Candidatus Gottesmanbacteria bacterium RIFCSPHIGHO2_02_FULL_39_11]|uniref:Uncharacterized protein n=1 Tax=Candidatus Gottesmanbacteria bacterium RIFCSPHIGHO2_02_FULL_39_11 TaxID=1798382 RepID=A0A1F5ZSQ3_9BACT|nr:MAG: hypothetical protein A3D77_07740 [Candidatus Gottesmanbacteria bacterium RIFCSPHIGHO2_02_FULL_39_11]
MADDATVPPLGNSRTSFGDILNKLKDVKVSIPEFLPTQPNPPVQNLPQEPSIPSSPVESPSSASPVPVSPPPIQVEPSKPVEIRPLPASPVPNQSVEPGPKSDSIPADQPSDPSTNADRPDSTKMADPVSESGREESTNPADHPVESSTNVADTIDEPGRLPQTNPADQIGSSDKHAIEDQVKEGIKRNAFEKLNHANQERARRRMIRMNKIVDYVKVKGKVTNKEVRTFLHVSQSAATDYLTELVTKGLLKLEKKARISFYHF